MIDRRRLVAAALLAASVLCGCGKLRAFRDAGGDSRLFDLKGNENAPGGDGQGIMTMADQAFGHFMLGTFTQGGVKIYASRAGRLQLMDRADINLDGKVDFVITNSHDGKTHLTNSYIVWGGNIAKPSWAEVPTKGASACAVADLDDDGYPDLVFANQQDDSTRAVNSYIYWGSSTGIASGKPSELPTVGANDVAVADLDRDGYLDLVFANGTDDKKATVNSYIYWGSSQKFADLGRHELPTLDARGVVAADIGGDKIVDLVFANHTDGTSYAINSYIYHGSVSGFWLANRKELPTMGANGVTVADFNSDGYLEIVFSNHWDGKKYEENSFIYWGATGGYAPSLRLMLPTKGAGASLIADLDRDLVLDLAVANERSSSSYKVNSVIFRGPITPTGFKEKLSVPTNGARGVMAGDLNNDSYIEMLFCNNKASSDLFTVVGTSVTKAASIPSKGGTRCITADLGSVENRVPGATFVSRILDTGLTNPRFLALTWKATTPPRTALTFQLRSGANSAALQSAAWYGPLSKGDIYNASLASTSATINQIHNGQRFIQYRATLKHDFTDTPVLERVEITYRLGNTK